MVIAFSQKSHVLVFVNVTSALLKCSNPIFNLAGEFEMMQRSTSGGRSRTIWFYQFNPDRYYLQVSLLLSQ